MTTGMFLFAKLVMLNLYDQITREHFINEINESRFPRGLQEAYVKLSLIQSMKQGFLVIYIFRKLTETQLRQNINPCKRECRDQRVGHCSETLCVACMRKETT